MPHSKNNDKRPSSRVKTRAEVAAAYGISARTLRRRLKKHQIQLPPGRIVPKDLERIYRALGEPLFKEDERELT